jgi:glyoxylase I family protein
VIQVETLHHVSIPVTDRTRAKRFYSDILGLREIPRPPFDFEGAWYQLGDRQLHLIVHPGTRTLRGTTAIDSRDGHFGLRVRSYRQTLDHLKAQGVTCRDRPRNLTAWPQIYVTDPDGNVIELNAERLD